MSPTNTGYTVEQSTNGGVDWSVLTTGLAGTATSYSDTSATEATDYRYEVFATGGGGNSAISNVASVTSLPAGPVEPFARIQHGQLCQPDLDRQFHRRDKL